MKSGSVGRACPTWDFDTFGSARWSQEIRLLNCLLNIETHEGSIRAVHEIQTKRSAGLKTHRHKQKQVPKIETSVSLPLTPSALTVTMFSRGRSHLIAFLKQPRSQWQMRNHAAKLSYVPKEGNSMFLKGSATSTYTQSDMKDACVSKSANTRAESVWCHNSKMLGTEESTNSQDV